MHSFHYISEKDIQHLTVADDELLLVLIQVSALHSSFSDWQNLLSKEEMDKAMSFRADADRNTYACAHAFLRTILSVLLQCKPTELFFLKETSGKPYVQSANIMSGNQTIHFSLSHSGNYVALCFHTQHTVGVDVEQINPSSDYSQIAESYFSEQEKLDYNQAENKLIFFLKQWTAKEASGKVTGDGIAKLQSLKLPEGYVSTCHIEEQAVLSACYPEGSVSKNYYII